MNRYVPRPTAIAAGLVADRVLGEPPQRVHPVAAFGTVMHALERRVYADAYLPGVAHAGVGLALGATAGLAGRSGAMATTVATGVAVAGRGLVQAAVAVADALGRDDLAGARTLLPALVGRDPSTLDEKDICRAVVESVAENTVDAVVAPALWALAAGAPGALGYRAVNTLDAMVGHRCRRYRRYGWASARLDDAANWVPARVAAILVATVRPWAAARVWRVVRRDAPAHPSPNSGVAEAAFAAALGLRLGGESRYRDRVEVRPALGDGRPPERADIFGAVALSGHVGTALVVALGGAGAVSAPRRR